MRWKFGDVHFMRCGGGGRINSLINEKEKNNSDKLKPKACDMVVGDGIHTLRKFDKGKWKGFRFSFVGCNYAL